MRTYTCDVTRDGDFWLIYVRESDLFTQARTVGEIEYMARDLIVCMGGDDEVELRFDPPLDELREPEAGSDPMVTTSLRLPKSVLDAVRACAQEDRVNVSVLLRNWIEQKLIEFKEEPHLTVTERVENLEARMKQTWELVVKVEEMVTTR